jgi:hypothetical protein
LIFLHFIYLSRLAGFIQGLSRLDDIAPGTRPVLFFPYADDRIEKIAS